MASAGRPRRARVPFAALVSASLLAAPLARATICESIESRTMCEGTVTDSGTCFWNGGSCFTLVGQLSPGIVAITEVPVAEGGNTGSATSNTTSSTVSPSPDTATAAGSPDASPASEAPTPEEEGSGDDDDAGLEASSTEPDWGASPSAAPSPAAAPAPAPTPLSGASLDDELWSSSLPAPEREGPVIEDEEDALLYDEEVEEDEEEARAAAAFCTLPSVAGPCRAYFSRWYYDSSSEQCVPFIYGGCQGNANNFETFAECSAAAEMYCSGQKGDD